MGTGGVGAGSSAAGGVPGVALAGSAPWEPWIR